MDIVLYVENEGTLCRPVVLDGITLESRRSGEPGILRFDCLSDEKTKIAEGNAVSLYVGGKGVFRGYIFRKKRSKEKKLEITAYDQLRYLKNKDTYVYKEKRADEVVAMIARDFALQTGELENTEYVVPARSEDDKTLFDIIQDALTDTLLSTGRLFVLYDDFGKLCLKNIENMKLDTLIDSQTGEDYSYSSGIDDDTYNQIKLVFDNEETGGRSYYTQADPSNIHRWGILQYYEKLDNPEGGEEKARALLKLYNKKSRTLSIEKAFGDIRVRAGSSLPVILDLGDVQVKNYMAAEKVKHSFEKGRHTMALTLRGGDFGGEA